MLILRKFTSVKSNLTCIYTNKEGYNELSQLYNKEVISRLCELLEIKEQTIIVNLIIDYKLNINVLFSMKHVGF